MRWAERRFVVEGVKVLGAAFDAGAPVETVYFSPEVADHPGAAELVARARSGGTRCVPLRAGVIESVADTTTPQPVCAVVRFVDVGLGAIGGATPVVVAVDVRDPGNLGALVRVVDASGAGGVVVCDGSADPFSPKAVRASAGSIFQVPVVAGLEVPDALAQLAAAGYLRLGAVARRGQDYAAADLSGLVSIVVGNEARGLTRAHELLLDGEVSIPMPGRAESLNVAMAAAVLCFEIRRRARVGH